MTASFQIVTPSFVITRSFADRLSFLLIIFVYEMLKSFKIFSLGKYFF